MSVEIHNNFNPKKSEHLDGRLVSVDTFTSLPDPTVAGNFLYLGALAYVKDVNSHYRIELVSSVSTWVKYDSAGYVEGTINIVSGNPILDLSLTTPDISTCTSVRVNVVGGTSTTVQTVTNLPEGAPVTLLSAVGHSVTYTHTDYDSVSVGSIVLEVGFDMTVIGRVVGDESLSLKKQGTVVCQWDSTQFMKSSEWASSLVSIAIEDTLSSTSTSTALSSNQGRILDGKISSKQDILTAGAGISLSTGNVISSISDSWVNSTPSSSSAGTITDVATFLVGLFSASVSNYRYVDLRVLGSNPNLGLWMLPPSLDPTVNGNWINIDLADNSKKVATYKLAADGSVNSSIIGSVNYHAQITPSTLLGDNIGITFNSDGLADNKVSFAVPTVGTYNIKAEVTLSVTSATSLSDVPSFDALLYQTAGVQSVSTPSSGGTVVERKSYPAQYTQDGLLRYPTVLLDFTVAVTAIGLDNGFTVAVNNNSIGTFTNISMSSFGKLIITKL
tara:strand:+ start:2371 stop:3873 length:1503 start_codon:yes stop_codon:yes gene_type:complete